MKSFKRDLEIAAAQADYELTNDQLIYLLANQDKIEIGFSFVEMIMFFLECKDKGFEATVARYDI